MAARELMSPYIKEGKTMKHLKKTTSQCVRLIALFVAVGCLFPGFAGAVCNCWEDTAFPPFLAEGAVPNLLLMIDNSASMLDIGYHDSSRESWECFDNSYSSDEIYKGYFDETAWYLYNATYGYFDPVATAPSMGSAHGGTMFTSDSMSLELSGNETDGWVFEELYATGSFLNWATTSKYDIEKKILTGGKYEDNDGTDAIPPMLVSEGRGCSGYRFVKQVALSSGAITYYLDIGIRSDDYDGFIDLLDRGEYTTVMDIFGVSTDGYDYGACYDAIDEVMNGTGNPQQAVGDCIDPQNEAKNPEKQVLIHSTTDCWKYWKGDLNNWPQHTETLIGFCQEVYESGTDPREILPSDPAYACFGNWAENFEDATGYIGQCWQTGSVEGEECPQVECVGEGIGDYGEYVSKKGVLYRCKDGGIEYCTDSYKVSGNTYACTSEEAWIPVVECPVGVDSGWDTGDLDGDHFEEDELSPIGDDLELCIKYAMMDYCADIEMPQVTDPSDLEMSQGQVYNLPAILTDGGLLGQLGEPITNLDVLLTVADGADEPSGILQEFSDRIRIGAMAFNRDGSAYECDHLSDPYVTFDCISGNSRDGASILWPIGSDAETAGHTDNLVAEINGTDADTWTPLAEAMYTAIGYYTQDPNMELNAADGFLNYSGWPKPITEWCQDNNVLFITDGSSTADLHKDVVVDFDADGDGTVDYDGDSELLDGCGVLYGSTYFDGWTYYARQEDIFSGSPYAFEADPKNISTWVVYTGDTNDTGDECSAYTLMENAVANGGPNAAGDAVGTDQVLLGGDYDQLSASLERAFGELLKRASAGSAASVISTTKSGEGAVYQAIFWPAQDGPTTDDPDVVWTGDVHALLMDTKGNFYEDSGAGSEHALDTSEDERVILQYSEEEKKTIACNPGDDDVCDPGDPLKNLDQVNYLWSAADWLAGISELDIGSNRSPYISENKQRYIYTWNDLNNDGVVDDLEYLPFEPGTDWNGKFVAANRGSVTWDFGVDPAGANPNAEVDDIVRWVRGEDVTGYRTRTVNTPESFDNTSDTISWRLGDVIYSTPTLVARPEENYYSKYRDDTYGAFVRQNKYRRSVVYFGANDGMIHAVNGGFYKRSEKKFYNAIDKDANGVVTYSDKATAPGLGAELWAYVPYNLLPQLKCLTEPDYYDFHKYFVDLKPRVFDVRIWDKDADPEVSPTDHPWGWGTIMVVGMRLGGGSVDADAAGDARKFVSAYVIFDITNPEEPPVLLGELTFDSATSAHLGYSTMVPVVVPMTPSSYAAGYDSRKNADTKWYLVMGNGPVVLEDDGTWVPDTALGGVSNQQAKLAVFPLDKLTAGEAFRIPDSAPDADAAGIFYLTDDVSGDPVTGFVSDPITIDYNLNFDYRADAVYFGTVEGDYADTDTGTGWGGRLYRLITNAETDETDPTSWNLKEVVNPGRPITAAPMAGWDGFNFWVYFGTGRFFDVKDKTDSSSMAQESYYGIKETRDCNDNDFDWPTVDLSNLVQTGSIWVSDAADANNALLSCYDYDASSDTYSLLGTTCLDTYIDANSDGDYTFAELDEYVGGTGCNISLENTGEAGWAHAFDYPGERNLGQATLLGGLVTFTTYQPFEDICKMEGLSYLYALYYRTGTSWHEAIFDSIGSDPVEYRKDLGQGVATTPALVRNQGDEDDEGVDTFAQTSTGAIVRIEEPNLPVENIRTGRMYWRAD
jgi:type IV pilus assembly protein PilY1